MIEPYKTKSGRPVYKISWVVKTASEIEAKALDAYMLECLQNFKGKPIEGF